MCGPAAATAEPPRFIDTHRAETRFAFELSATPRRVVRLDLPDGRELRYGLPECFVHSSETGAFAYLDEVRNEPYVVVICGTASDDSSLYIFAPDRNISAPVYALTDKPGLSVSLSMGGLAMTWRATDMAAKRWDGAFWEPDRANFGSARFQQARDRAIGKSFAVDGRLPDGLDGDEYFLARRPDTPLRLGPSLDAPYFQRLADRVLVHAPDPATEKTRPVWRLGGWLRVCIVDGGCGYAPEESVVPAARRGKADP